MKQTSVSSSNEVRITPQHVVQHNITRKEIDIESIGVAPVVVLSWGTKVVEWIAGNLDAELSPHWFYGDRESLYTAEIDGQKVSVARVPVGAPGTVMHMEEMIACGAHTFIGLGWAGACGAHTFIGLGWAGGLQPHTAIGQLLIPTACVRQEGTSPHYIEDEGRIKPDPGLVDLLTAAARAEGLAVHHGTQWTTDAPYRELVSQIETYRGQGVLGVDMETSAMYALGQYRKVRVANLLVVSDEVWREWRPAFGTKTLVQSTKRAQKVVEMCLADILNG
jgi:uridine phosphorylase